MMRKCTKDLLSELGDTFIVEFRCAASKLFLNLLTLMFNFLDLQFFQSPPRSNINQLEDTSLHGSNKNMINSKNYSTYYCSFW